MNLEIDDIIKSINKFPERNAFFIQEKYYTYGQLGQKISDISILLEPCYNFISPKHIGVVIYDDLESYASCICILLSGNGYVPLNPLNPLNHNLEVLEQAEVGVILSSRDFNETGLKSEGRFNLISTGKLWTESAILRFPQSKAEDPAYVIFTSGSTGKPKGAVIQRRNLNSFLDSVSHLGWQLSEDDKFLQMANLGFDMSILTFILPLCLGACIYTIPENEIKYIYGYKLMQKYGITFIAMVPSTLNYLKSYFSEILIHSVRYSLICGESFPIKLAEQWQKCVPGSAVINIYGPSEATVFTNYYQFNNASNNKSYNGIMAIGNIVENMSAIIVDEGGKEVQAGDKGELCISGDQLTSGYLSKSKKTSESFFSVNSGDKGKCYYRTGDIVFKDTDDCYFYVGRRDSQVKIQGHRIELVEIEKHARDMTQNESVVAIPKKTTLGNYKILLYSERVEIRERAILEYLKSKLPYFMVPSDIIFLNKLPLNNNGKIDRLLLSQRDEGE